MTEYRRWALRVFAIAFILGIWGLVFWWLM
jgi:hypothetical protein